MQQPTTFETGYGGLGALLLRAGVEPARTEDMVRDVLAMQLDAQIAGRHFAEAEAQALRHAVADGMERMCADQEKTLGALRLCLTSLRMEASQARRRNRAALRISHLLFILVFAAQIALGAAAYLLWTEWRAEHALLRTLDDTAETESDQGGSGAG